MFVLHDFGLLLFFLFHYRMEFDSINSLYFTYISRKGPILGCRMEIINYLFVDYSNFHDYYFDSPIFEFEDAIWRFRFYFCTKGEVKTIILYLVRLTSEIQVHRIFSSLVVLGEEYEYCAQAINMNVIEKDNLDYEITRFKNDPDLIRDLVCDELSVMISLYANQPIEVDAALQNSSEISQREFISKGK